VRLVRVRLLQGGAADHSPTGIKGFGQEDSYNPTEEEVMRVLAPFGIAFADWEPVPRYVKDMAVQLQRRLAAIDETVYCTPGLRCDCAEGRVNSNRATQLVRAARNDSRRSQGPGTRSAFLCFIEAPSTATV